MHLSNKGGKRSTLWRIMFLSYLIVLILVSVVNISDIDKVTTINFDKLAHVIMYSGLSFLMLHAFRQLNVFVVFLICAVIGTGLEFVQEYLTTTRMLDFYDILYNIIGSVVGIWFFVYSIRKLGWDNPSAPD